MQVLLASASPRRQELLREARIEFLVKPANILEIREPGEPPRAFAERMAREKALAVWAKERSALVLGADTIVVVDNVVLGKPQDGDEAARMLRLLSTRKHQVITGVALLGNDFEDVRSESTDVYFSEMNEENIREYVASGEPMDKAGAYAIQGGAARWISKIEGDYSNVVGLPVALVRQMLRERGAFEI